VNEMIARLVGLRLFTPYQSLVKKASFHHDASPPSCKIPSICVKCPEPGDVRPREEGLRVALGSDLKARAQSDSH